MTDWERREFTNEKYTVPDEVTLPRPWFSRYGVMVNKDRKSCLRRLYKIKVNKVDTFTMWQGRKGKLRKTVVENIKYH